MGFLCHAVFRRLGVPDAVEQGVSQRQGELVHVREKHTGFGEIRQEMIPTSYGPVNGKLCFRSVPSMERRYGRSEDPLAEFLHSGGHRLSAIHSTQVRRTR